MTEPVGSNGGGATRREFLKTSTVAAVGGAVTAGAGFLPNAHAAGSDTVRIGMIGCGGRGTGAATNAAEAAENVKIVAMADAFKDNLENSRSNLQKLGKQYAVDNDHAFVGLDAYKKLLECEVEYVILATPPGFRPQHLKAAVAAGKHVFTEKPVGTDGPGIRTVLEAAEEAKRKGLTIVAGTQRRHQGSYLASMGKIHDGAIGDVTGARVYWNQGGLWSREKQPDWSELEWQVRNWLYFSWLSGDHICEQHVHNLDVANWALGAHPVKAVALGGREVRKAPLYGNIFDHFAVDYEYPKDVHVASYCRQIDGTEGNVSETVVGTKGTWTSQQQKITGEHKWQYRSKGDKDPYVQEHIDLIESLRSGKPLNELKQVAESTLTAILGRMAAYTGKAVTWDEALNSKEDLFPRELNWGPNKVPSAAVPGTTPLA